MMQSVEGLGGLHSIQVRVDRLPGLRGGNLWDLGEGVMAIMGFESGPLWLRAGSCQCLGWIPGVWAPFVSWLVSWGFGERDLGCAEG